MGVLCFIEPGDGEVGALPGEAHDAPGDEPRDLHDPDPAAFSGVRRGPLRPGEWVRLTDAKGRQVLVPATQIAYVDLGQEHVRPVGFGAIDR